jgi:opacity protein-like surface antigen
MKSNLALAIALSSFAAAASAADAPDAAAPAASAATPDAPAPDADFCFFSNSPTGGAKYKVMKRVKQSKGTYGGVRDELPAFVGDVRAAGGDAVINYNGSQRFGFWPWRMVHPVLTGVAIKWVDKAPDCAAAGGSTMGTIMSTNKEPAKQ